MCGAGFVRGVQYIWYRDPVYNSQRWWGGSRLNGAAHQNRSATATHREGGGCPRRARAPTPWLGKENDGMDADETGGESHVVEVEFNQQQDVILQYLREQGGYGTE